MKKTALQLPLTGGALGGAIGGGLGYGAGGVTGATAGAILGMALGGWAGDMTNKVLTARNNAKFNKMVRGASKLSDAQLRQLLKNYRDAGDINVYRQVSGPKLDNAMYAYGWMPGEIKDMGWVDVRTGNKVDNPGPGVYIGKGFNVAPVLAHELGHASDLRGWRKALPYISSGAALLGLIATVASTSILRAGAATGRDIPVAVAGIGAAGLLASAVGQHIVERNERAASERAMEALSKVHNKRQRESDRKMLEAAYRTYEPVQLTPVTFREAMA